MAVERVSERYEIHGELASGGMATVHLGRLIGPAGFCRTIAIKRLHPQFAKDPAFVAMFMDEARLAARIQHPNVVPTLDVVMSAGELFLIMEYVVGASLATLMRQPEAKMPVAIAVAVARDMCAGMHAAHEACDVSGRPLGIVHRDVSPQNVLVGRDGVARVFDFGIAKAASRSHTTRDGSVKGKIPYMAPEQLRALAVDRRADVYALGVVLWEMLAARRLFTADDPAAVIAMVLGSRIPTLGDVDSPASEDLEKIAMRALSADPEQRFATAAEMGAALECTNASASARDVAQWIAATIGPQLQDRAAAIEAMHTGTVVTEVPAATKGEPRQHARAETPRMGDSAADTNEPLRPVAVADANGSATSDNASKAHDADRGQRSLLLAALIALAGLLGGVLLGPWLTTTAAEPTPEETTPEETTPVQSTPVRSTPVQSTPVASASVPSVPVVSAQGMPATQPPSPAISPTTSSPPTAPTRTSPPAPTTTTRTATTMPDASSAAAPSPATPTFIPKRAGPSKPGCNPPFTLDADGIKTFKPWCL